MPLRVSIDIAFDFALLSTYTAHARDVASADKSLYPCRLLSLPTLPPVIGRERGLISFLFKIFKFLPGTHAT